MALTLFLLTLAHTHKSQQIFTLIGLSSKGVATATKNTVR